MQSACEHVFFSLFWKNVCHILIWLFPAVVILVAVVQELFITSTFGNNNGKAGFNVYWLNVGRYDSTLSDHRFVHERAGEWTSLFIRWLRTHWRGLHLCILFHSFFCNATLADEFVHPVLFHSFFSSWCACMAYIFIVTARHGSIIQEILVFRRGQSSCTCVAYQPHRRIQTIFFYCTTQKWVELMTIWWKHSSLRF